MEKETPKPDQKQPTDVKCTHENDICKMKHLMKQQAMNDFGFYDWAIDPFWGGFGFDHLFHNHIESVMDNFDKQFNNQLTEKDSHMVRQSFTSNTVFDKEGKPVTEKLISRETAKVGKDGQKITEKNEVYKNSGDQFSRVVSEKGLGDKVVKVTKEIKDKKQTETRNLQNIQEKEVEDFNKQWQKVADEEHFYHHRIGDHKKKTMIGNETKN